MTESTIQGPYATTIKRFQQAIADMKRWREETDDEYFKRSLTEYLVTYEKHLEILIRANNQQ